MVLIDAIRTPVAIVKDGRVVESNPAYRAIFGNEPPPSGARIEFGNRVFLVDTRNTENGILMSFEERTDSETLAAMRHYQRLLHASLSHATYTLDAQFRFRSFNRAAEDLLGWKSDEVVGRTSLEVMKLEDESQREESRNRLLAGDSVHRDVRVLRKDGSVVDVFFAIVPIREDDGRIIGYSGIMNDISETKRLERDLREYARALEDANRELESFSSSVSHDLRSPLRAIHGYASIIAEDFDGALDPEAKRLFGNIQRSALRMGKLIDDLLEFSRIGRREVAAEPVDMNVLALATIEEAKEPSRTVDFRVESLPDATGDAALLRQVWLNLLTNAVKYTRRRENAVVTIRGERRGAELVYSVEDNGEGFDMKYAGQLFGVFNRLHADFEGTGVGLALVRRIIHRHGGEVSADGVEGRGATFTFTLPVRDVRS